MAATITGMQNRVAHAGQPGAVEDQVQVRLVTQVQPR
jgi:hypothetical protein